MAIRSFKKCGVDIDGTKNNKISTRGLNGYIMFLPEEEGYHGAIIQIEITCKKIPL